MGLGEVTNLLVTICLFAVPATSFLVSSRRGVVHPHPSSGETCHAFATSTTLFSGGFGAQKSKPKAKKMNASQAKKAQKQLLLRYGGDIASGTSSRIARAIDALDPHLKEAAGLYKQVTQFDALVSPMTEEDRKRLIPLVQEEMANADRARLLSLMEDHDISEQDLHNVYQEATWSASADAKATQADIAGNKMKPELQDRITKACRIAVDASQCEDSVGRVLDVGCGHGSIVLSLTEEGLGNPDMYVGVDLSPEMINAAVERYGSERNGRTGNGRTFIAADFLRHDFEGEFDSVIFCSALHDMPDCLGTIEKAATLLRTGGKLIIIHAQGAQHVLGQHKANPVMVKRGLPLAQEWKEMIASDSDLKLELDIEPADPRSTREEREGYLAVLTKTL
ncbi:hypothetical protein THAOC_16295 [Thalassiosira oceanica]|uniref:Methyltransferase domain-containing protein n=1 Tax=Thalassiosira oceanica TaxID=159749 RepID=K0SCH6_THAOC|nr:hypothetical protein THAOC_16295 [Thalassiosira oceanica]|eukprot:EJK63070.1 hypothetical protein THAOC_16295 [Thalassiosira oceanica]